MTDQTTGHQPLTADDLDQIERHDRAYAVDPSDAPILVEAATDRHRLLAEVRRLQAEAREQSLLNGAIGNNMIRNNAALHDRVEELTRERDEARAERDRARLAGAQILAERDALAARLDAVQNLSNGWLEDARDRRARLDQDEDYFTSAPADRSAEQMAATLIEGCARQLNDVCSGSHLAESSIVDPVEEPCDACRGTGRSGTYSQPAGQPYADYSPDLCLECAGRGRVIVTNPAHDACLGHRQEEPPP